MSEVDSVGVEEWGGSPVWLGGRAWEDGNGKVGVLVALGEVDWRIDVMREDGRIIGTEYVIQ